MECALATPRPTTHRPRQEPVGGGGVWARKTRWPQPPGGSGGPPPPPPRVPATVLPPPPRSEPAGRPQLARLPPKKGKSGYRARQLSTLAVAPRATECGRCGRRPGRHSGERGASETLVAGRAGPRGVRPRWLAAPAAAACSEWLRRGGAGPRWRQLAAAARAKPAGVGEATASSIGPLELHAARRSQQLPHPGRLQRNANSHASAIASTEEWHGSLEF